MLKCRLYFQKSKKNKTKKELNDDNNSNTHIFTFETFETRHLLRTDQYQLYVVALDAREWGQEKDKERKK